jgi:hypothetical protein
MAMVSGVSRIDGIPYSDPARMLSTTRRVLAQSPHLDVGEQAFFLRELEQIFKEQYDVKYAVLKGKQMVPIRHDLDPGAENFTWAQFNYSGKAKRIKDFSQDFPMAQTNGVQFVHPVVSYGSGFRYSIDELRSALKVGRSIDRLRAFAARKMIDQQVDQVLALGDTDVDDGAQFGSNPMYGLINQPSTLTLAPAVVSGNTQWQNWSTGSPSGANKTSDQIIADVSSLIAYVPSQTLDVEHVRRIVMPVTDFEYIKNTPRSTVSDTTILKFLEDNNPEIEFMSWERLTGQGAANTGWGSSGNGDRMIAYNPDPMELYCPISIEFEQLAPQLDNMAYKVLCRTKMGGVVAPYPKSICYMDGI